MDYSLIVRESTINSIFTDEFIINNGISEVIVMKRNKKI